MQIPPSSIFISRTDNIGDVVLTIPITYALKQQFPHTPIYFICSEYTYPLLKYVQTIDVPIIYNQVDKLKSHLLIDKQTYGILVYPTYDTARQLSSLKIPHRIGTSHRWYNWLYCNEFIHFSRKKSDLHEAQLNFKLLKPFGITDIPLIHQLYQYYQLKPLLPLRSDLKKNLDASKIKIIIHPKSRGSAREWGIKNFIYLIKLLNVAQYQVIITGTKNEWKDISAILSECPHVTSMVGQTTIDDLLSLINECDGLVANSTGVLHIAAMLGKLSIGLFPSIKPLHPGRWAPIGKNAFYITYKDQCNACKHTPQSCHCIQSIAPEKVIYFIEKYFSSQSHLLNTRNTT